LAENNGRVKRRSRVLEYFEAQKAEQDRPEETESGGEDSFQDFDAAFGLDRFGAGSDK
jgi:hypothetical protein